MNRARAQIAAIRQKTLQKRAERQRLRDEVYRKVARADDTLKLRLEV